MSNKHEVKDVEEAHDIPEWIKPEIFEDTLRTRFPGYKTITHFNVKRGAAPGENYATIMLRVQIKVELEDGQEKNVSYVLKIAHDNEMFKLFLKELDMFEVEAGMYSDIVPDMMKLYHDAGCDIKFGPSSYKLPVTESYILLEDLSVYGFKNTNRIEGLDMEHAKAVLQKLAQWHAASATLVETKGLYPDVYLSGLYTQGTKPFIEKMNKTSHNIFLEGVNKLKGHENYYDSLVKVKENFLDLIIETGKYDPEEFNVLNHGDCWSTNIMFQYDDNGKIKETYFIDYQLPKYGTPAQDLFYFILSSTKLEIKLNQFDYFIYYYHQQLIKHLTLLKYPKALPALSELHKHLYKYGIWAYGSVTDVMTAVLCDPTELASLENFVNDSSEGEAFKKLMFTNPRFSSHAELVLPWLYNRGAFEC